MVTTIETVQAEQRKSLTPGVIAYLLLLAACVALIHPFANTGISDDFSYIKSAKDFADTGRIVYNGWSAPIIGWLIPFGALFIKLFGFSFTTVRIATFSIAVVNGILAQWILLRLGCTRVLALLGASAIMLSPVTLGTAMLFFTDGPGLLTLLVTLALCISAVHARTSRSTIAWIAAAFLASFFLGTVRQLLWLCTLVVVPCTVWLVRKRRGVLLWSSACPVLCAAGMALVMRWWRHQPYALIEPVVRHFPLTSWARFLVLPFMELAVLMAPVLSLFLRRRVSKRIYLISLALAVLVPLVISYNPYDLLQTCSRDIFANAPQWVYLIALGYSFGLIPIVARTTWEAYSGNAIVQQRGEITFYDLSVIVLPVSAALFIVADSRESFFARYLVPVIAALMIWLVKLWSDLTTDKQRCGFAGPLVIAIYCALGVIQLHDLYRQTNAVLSLSNWYTAQGMPRDQLEAGFAFDGWYQIQRMGYINESLIEFPVGAYVNHDLPRDIAPCHNFFLPETPSIHPVYGIGESLAPCFDPPVLHTAEYTAWMAPHQHTVFIARYSPQYALP